MKSQHVLIKSEEDWGYTRTDSICRRSSCFLRTINKKREKMLSLNNANNFPPTRMIFH